MISISVIGHNEEYNIGRCLESVRWADEVVFVDCASCDRTAAIAAKFTGKIFFKDNNPNLNVNKQFGIDNCSNEWVLYLDPDEIITPELKDEIVSVIKSGSAGVSGYLIPRKNFYFGKFLRFGGKYPDYQLRLFRKDSASFPCRNVHEKIKVCGKILKLKNSFLHYPYKNISEMTVKSEFYTSRKAEYLYAAGKNSRHFFPRPLFKFLRNFILKAGFLDGFTGLVVAVMDSYNEFISFLKLEEMKRDRHNDK